MNRRRVSKYILRVPLMIMIDAIIFTICLLIDGSMTSTSEVGHPAPYLTLIVGFILVIVTVFVIIQSLYKVISSVIHKDDKPSNISRKKTHPIIPILISYGVSLLILYFVGSNEINSFYNDPTHIGFAVPVVTFMVAIVLFIICFIIAVFSIWQYKKK